MSLPDFDIEIIKTTKLFSPNKKAKHSKSKPQMTSMKTVEINEDSNATSEAKAIYGNSASGAVKIATREEVQDSVCLDNKPSEKKINLFKKRVKSPKGPMLHNPAPVDERLMLEPVLKEKKRKEMKK